MVSDNTCRWGLGAALLTSAVAAVTAEQVQMQPADVPTFVTWPNLEPDKCASIWLIRRHVSPQAHILFFAPEDQIPDGIPFDTPDAQLRRYHNASTYEMLVSRYRIGGDRVAYVGRLIHDIEINTWARKALPETREIETRLADALSSVAVAGAVDFCIDYFDRLTQDLVPDRPATDGHPGLPQ